ncbi:hypothetical protein Bbelb_341080 [Branchiostoma belcheri]|nr:hypothetical protein Bbelb_341080 [Branchiostoma belcheri]
MRHLRGPAVPGPMRVPYSRCPGPACLSKTVPEPLRGPYSRCPHSRLPARTCPVPYSGCPGSAGLYKTVPGPLRVPYSGCPGPTRLYKTVPVNATSGTPDSPVLGLSGSAGLYKTVPGPMRVPYSHCPGPTSLCKTCKTVPGPLRGPYSVSPGPACLCKTVPVNAVREKRRFMGLQRFWIRMDYPEPSLSMVLDKARFWIQQSNQEIKSLACPPPPYRVYEQPTLPSGDELFTATFSSRCAGSRLGWSDSALEENFSQQCLAGLQEAFRFWVQIPSRPQSYTPDRDVHLNSGPPPGARDSRTPRKTGGLRGKMPR